LTKIKSYVKPRYAISEIFYVKDIEVNILTYATLPIFTAPE